MDLSRKMSVIALENTLRVRMPEPELMLSMDSPATELLSDFARSIPPMVEGSTPVDEVDSLMRREHCTYKIVISSDEQFLGIITSLDIHSSETMRATMRTGLPRNELPVTEVMVPRSELHGMLFSKFERASVGDVVGLLGSLGERFLLVIDDDTRVLRGLVSSRDVIRRLALPEIPIKPARTFSEIQAVLGH
jgi:CBS domain-containing protein